MLPVNPDASVLGRENAVLWGRTRQRYHVADFPGPLSIKAVLRGQATWETMEGRYRLGSDSYLLLNDGQRYSITVDTRGEEVETFCVFFARGFVEDVRRSSTSPDSRLLDEPWGPGAPFAFLEASRPQGDAVSRELERLQSGVVARGHDGLWSDERFLALAAAIVGADHELGRCSLRIDVVRASTRRELVRRVLRARDFLEAHLAEPLSLAALAREACLSPYHFHRLFTAIFGETPKVYVSRRRLALAAERLERRHESVADVGLAVGFETLSAFTDQFRRRYGVSPGRWRQQIRKNPADLRQPVDAD